MEDVILDKVITEECIICFDETDKFIVFICNHKTCYKCYPLLMEQRPNCPLCNKSLLPSQYTDISQYTNVTPFTLITPFTRDTRINSDPTCALFLCVCVFASLIFYIVVIGGSVYVSEKNKR